VLIGRLRAAIARLLGDGRVQAREDALRKVLRSDSPSLVSANRAFHALLRNGEG
jgi:type I restriction enzyme R subunit